MTHVSRRLYPATLLALLLHAPALLATGHCECMHDCAHTARHEAVLRGQVELDELRFSGTRVRELSGLAWDADTHTLYAVSDRGVLVSMRPRFAKQPGSVRAGQTKPAPRGQEAEQLVGVEPLSAAPLQDPQGAPLAGAYRDSEGLAIAADGTLLVSFERRPRICAYHPDGRHAGCRELSQTLQDRDNYQDGNLALEALAIVPGGKLLTGPEAPLRSVYQAQQLHLYEAGPRAPEAPRVIATHHRRGLLTGLAALADGRLLVLERRKTFFPVHTPTAVHVYYPRCATHDTFLLLAIGGRKPRLWVTAT